MIGRGSYGEVWLARNIIGTYRAVKVVYRKSFEDERPFEREFAGIQKFEPISRTHESQVDVLQVGKGDGYFYYVMELADDSSEASNAGLNSNDTKEGTAPPSPAAKPYVPRTLKLEMRRRRQLPIDECIRIGLALTTALAHLHKNRLAHRDIKPSNIIYVDGMPKLADIGLVSDIDATRSFVGTLGFVPPEGPGSPQADIYSLGKVLYEISTGRDRQEFPELPTDLGSDTEKEERFLELNEIILKACDNRPDRRYQTAEAMHSHLALLQKGKSVRHQQAIERRLRLVSRVGIVTAAIAALAIIGYLYENLEMRAARRLSNENRKLAQENAAKAEDIRRQLLQIKVAGGLKKAEEGDPYSALLSFADALQIVKPNSQQERSHRLRFQFIFDQCPKLVQLFVHRAKVNWCEFSPDGSRIVTASADGTAQLRDVESGAQLVPPLLHGTNVLMARFSPHAEWLATACADGRVRVWNPSTGILRWPPFQHTGAVNWINFNPAGDRLITASDDGSARIWDLTTGQEATPSLKHRGPVKSAEFSPDGLYAVTASTDKTAQLWNAQTGQSIGKPFLHEAAVNQATFSPDGKWIGTGSGDMPDNGHGDEARIWETSSGQMPLPPLVLHHAVRFIQFTPDGQGLAMANAVGARIWGWKMKLSETQNFQEIRKVQFTHLALSPDGEILITASESGRAAVWDVRVPRKTSAVLYHHGAVTHADFNKEGQQIVTSGEDGTVKVWDLRVGFNSQMKLQTQFPATRASFNRDGSKILTGGVETCLFDAFSGRPLWEPILGDTALQASLSPDDRFILTCGGTWPEASARAQLWDASNGKPLGGPFPENSTNVVQAIFDKDGSKICTLSADGEVKIWSTATRQPLTRIFGQEHRARTINFSPDGTRIITADQDQVARVWDTTSGHELFKIPHQVEVDFAAFSPDGQRIVTVGEDESIYVWTERPGAFLLGPLMAGSKVAETFFNAEGSRIATCGYAETLKIFDLPTGRSLLPVFSHDQRIYSGKFSRDSWKLLTTSADATARIWDAETGELLLWGLKHDSDVLDADFSPDGERIVTASEDKTVRVWWLKECDYSRTQLQELAELLVGHRLDPYGNLSPLKPEELNGSFQHLRAQFPACFAVSTAEGEQWMRARIENYQSAGAKWRGARESLDELIQLHPLHADLYRERAEICAESGQWAQAAADYLKAKELGGNQFRIDLSLAVVALALKNQTNYQAICGRLLEKYSETDSSVKARLVVGVCALASNAISNPQALISLAQRADSRQWGGSAGSRERHFYALGNAYARGGRFAEALEQFQLGRSQAGGGPNYDLWEALLQAKLLHREEAQRLLENARSSRKITRRYPLELLSAWPDWAENVTRQCLQSETEAFLKSNEKSGK